MKTNIGPIDRMLRMIAGAGLIVLAVMGIGAPWTWIGVVPLATALIGWCPAYTLVGLNTCPLKQRIR